MTFENAFNFIVPVEGDYVNDPNDPGGETKFGISKRSYPHLDIKNLTIVQAKAIYLKDFWQACRCDDLPDYFRLALFDCAINQGVPSAIRILQVALGIHSDGVIGSYTVKIAKSVAGNKEFLANFLTQRAVRYFHTANFESYGSSWIHRLFSVAVQT